MKLLIITLLTILLTILIITIITLKFIIPRIEDIIDNRNIFDDDY